MNIDFNNLTKEQKQMIAVGIGVLILLFLFFGKNIGSKRHIRPKAKQSANNVSQIISTFDSNVQILAKKEINDSLEEIMDDKVKEGWERNPFEILVSTIPGQSMIEGSELAGAGPGSPEFTVSGIVHDESPQGSAVIIDGDFYKIGDTIDGWTVVNVEAESVYFKSGESEYIFNLYDRQNN